MEVIDCPFAHPMVGDLLHKLFSQKIKPCGNIRMWDMDIVKQAFAEQESLSITTVTFVLSLVSLLFG
jgi:hypothetical protein